MQAVVGHVSASEQLCVVCSTAFSVYTCPSCLTRYCSVACYKQHSESCTEQFYRGNVGTLMRGSFADKQQRKAMTDILERLQQLDVADEPMQVEMSTDKEEEEASTEAELSRVSEETLSRIINSETDAELASLISTIPAEDRRALETALAATAPSDFLQPWEAWWSKPETFSIRLGKDGTGLIEELQPTHDDPELESEDAPHMSTPPLPPTTPIPALESLSSTPPSPLMTHVLLQLLFAYCCALRLYNGDALADIESFVAFVWQLCPTMSTQTDAASVPATLDEAVHESVVQLRQLDVGLTHVCIESVASLGGAVWADVATMCSAGCGAVVCAVADLQRQHKLCEQHVKQRRREQGRCSRATSKLGLQRIKLSTRKLQFFMSLAHARSDAQYAQLSTSLQTIVESMQSDMKNSQHVDGWKKMLLVKPKGSIEKCNEA